MSLSRRGRQQALNLLDPKIDRWNGLATGKIGIKKGSKQHPKSTLMLLSPVNIIGAFSFLVTGSLAPTFSMEAKKQI